MALKHVLRLADKVAKNAFEPWKDRSWVYRCMGQRDGRATVGPRFLFFPLPPSYALPGTVPCMSVLNDVKHTVSESTSHAPSCHPVWDANETKRSVPGANTCFLISLLTRAYSPN